MTTTGVLCYLAGLATAVVILGVLSYWDYRRAERRRLALFARAKALREKHG